MGLKFNPLTGEFNSTSAASALFTSYARLSDTKGNNVQGGTSLSDDVQTRTLNTEDWDPDNIVTLSSNQFTLGAGSYYIKYRVPYMQTDRSLAYVYDVTNTINIQSSASAGYSVDSSGDDMDWLQNSCRVTLTANNVYEIRHYTQQARIDYGLGLAANAGVNEIYTVVEIYKE
tara:strand:- start:71 stop:589 length:519 start_codon:yes stop_codon:yes gene_type:complete